MRVPQIAVTARFTRPVHSPFVPRPLRTGQRGAPAKYPLSRPKPTSVPNLRRGKNGGSGVGWVFPPAPSLLSMPRSQTLAATKFLQAAIPKKANSEVISIGVSFLPLSPGGKGGFGVRACCLTTVGRSRVCSSPPQPQPLLPITGGRENLARFRFAHSRATTPVCCCPRPVVGQRRGLFALPLAAMFPPLLFLGNFYAVKRAPPSSSVFFAQDRQKFFLGCFCFPSRLVGEVFL